MAAIAVDKVSSVSLSLVAGDKVVPFDVGRPFIFPIRLGANADPVVALFGAQRLPELQSLVSTGQDGKPVPVSLVAIGPRRHGLDKDRISVSRAGLQIQAIESVDDKTCRVQLVDARWALSRLVCPCDFNVTVGVDVAGQPPRYQPLTTIVDDSACTIEEALRILDRATGYSFAQLVSGIGQRDFQLPDNMLFAGRMTVADTLDYILSHGGLALTVTDSGQFVAVNTSEAYKVDPKRYSWAQRPDAAALVVAQPKDVIVPFIHKQEIKAEAIGSSATVVRNGKEPELFLEQVYGFRGQFLTATELEALYVADYGSRGTTTGAMTTVINTNFNSTAWVGTLFQTTPKNVGDAAEGLAAKGAQEYVATIQRDYRTLFRIVANGLGETLLAGLTDIKFGVFDGQGRVVAYDENPKRGGVAASTVKAAYAVFYNYPVDGLGFADGWDSASAQGYSFRAAPFNVRWERSERERVIRLEFQHPGGGYGVVGNLSTVPTIRLATAEDLKDVDPGAGGADIQRRVIATQAAMDANLDLQVSMVATVATPNDLSRFIGFTRPGSGTDGTHYLGIDPSIAACRLSDGTTINQEACKVSADARADAYLQQFRYTQAASGLAHSVKLLADVKNPQGDLVEIALEFSTRGRAFIGTRVTWGKPTGWRARSALATPVRRAQTFEVGGQRIHSA